jgi:Cdc6-like AAA superfamily ATPase
MCELSLQQSAVENNDVDEQMLHRSKELTAIAKAIEPIICQHLPKRLLMFGPSGSGKTASAKFLIRKLIHHGHVRCAYVNCWNYYTQFDLLKAIAEKLGLVIAEGRVSSHELIYRIERVCEKNSCVIVLDEIDQLEEKRVLYSIGLMRAALILIANDEGALNRVDERIRSRLGPLERISFAPYQLPELEDIVEAHALALTSTKPDKSHLRRIAASAGGNAHLAIESLRLAGERAKEENSQAILERHVKQSVEVRSTIYKKPRIEQLNEHQQLLYTIIKESGEIKAGELHRKYREIASHPLTERAVRKYLHKLERFGFIRRKGFGRWRVYGIS